MAAHCSGCVFTAVCVLFGWVNCRARIPSMGHHTWPHVMSLSHFHFSISDIQVQVRANLKDGDRGRLSFFFFFMIGIVYPKPDPYFTLSCRCRAVAGSIYLSVTSIKRKRRHSNAYVWRARMNEVCFSPSHMLDLPCLTYWMCTLVKIMGYTLFR